jgi:hypothetical protein
LLAVHTQGMKRAINRIKWCRFSRISQRDWDSIFEFLCTVRVRSSEFRSVSNKEKESSFKSIIVPLTSHDATTLNEEATKEGHSDVLQR